MKILYLFVNSSQEGAISGENHSVGCAACGGCLFLFYHAAKEKSIYIRYIFYSTYTEKQQIRLPSCSGRRIL